MLECDEINVSTRINGSKPMVHESLLFAITGTLSTDFKFQPDVCNGCHDLKRYDTIKTCR